MPNPTNQSKKPNKWKEIILWNTTKKSLGFDYDIIYLIKDKASCKKVNGSRISELRMILSLLYS